MAKSLTQAYTRRLSQILCQNAAPKIVRSGSFSMATGVLERKSSFGGCPCSPMARDLHMRKASLPITAVLIDPTMVKPVLPAVEQAQDPARIAPIAEVVEPSKPRISYSISELLKLRNSNSTRVEISVPEVIDDGKPLDQTGGKQHVISFRSAASAKCSNKTISFHKDMDVTPDCVVTCSNLHESVDWPALTTFCKKSIGVSPEAVRMDRRQQPARAIIVFASAADASRFVAAVPEGAKLKGRKPQFRLGYTQ